MKTAKIAPARATTSQPSAALRPSGASSASTRAGSGFHDVPPLVVDKPACVSSLPQISQAYGSWGGPAGSASEATASARQIAAAIKNGDGVRPLHAMCHGIAPEAQALLNRCAVMRRLLAVCCLL